MAMAWYVVHTHSGYEQKAKAALEERIGGRFVMAQGVSTALSLICFGAQGLAMIDYLFSHRWNMPGWARGILEIIGVLFLTQGLMLCGLADHFFRLRRFWELREQAKKG